MTKSSRKKLTTPAPVLPPWSDADGWNKPEYYSTIQAGDVSGDDRAQLMARGPSGVEAWALDDSTGVWHQVNASTIFSDAAGWNEPQYYATIQFADINGDGKAEMLGRGPSGIVAYSFDTTRNQWNPLNESTIFGDGAGWNQSQYYSTIRFADIDGDGKAEMLGRGPSGIIAYTFDIASKQWQPLDASDIFSDGAGWNQSQYYSTIRFADIDGDGKAEMLGRGPSGIIAYTFDIASKQWQQLDASNIFSDGAGWNHPQYYSTIQFADINGDGKLELLGRGPTGLTAFAFDPSHAGWVELGSPSLFTDAEGWDQPQYYATIQCADINRDGKAELLGRGPGGMLSYAFVVAGSQWQPLGTPSLFSDADGWNHPQYYATIRLADINGDGKAELLGRSPEGENTYVFDEKISLWRKPSPLLKVDARLMENYRIDSAVGGVRVATAKNAQGQIEVFSIGSDGSVYNFYPDPASDTGWGQIPTGLNVSTSADIAAGQDADGRIVIFVANGPNLSYVVQDPGLPSRWAPPGTLTSSLRAFAKISCKNIGGQLYLGVATANIDGSGITVYWGQWNSANPSIGQQWLRGLTITPMPRIGWTARTSMYSDVTLMVCLGGLFLPFPVSGAAPSAAAPLPGISPHAAVLSMSVVDDASGNGILFAVLSDRGLYCLNTAAARDSWNWTQLSNEKQQFWKVFAETNSRGQLEAYAIGYTDHQLYHVRQDSTRPTGWSETVSLGIPAAAAAASRNGQGYSEIVTLYGSKDISKVWQNPDSDEWVVDQIKVQPLGTFRKIKSYTTEITVVDSGGQPSANQAIQLASADLALLDLNGTTHWVDAGRPYPCTSNLAGQVSINTETDSLTTPLLKVWTGNMDPDWAVVIEPNLDAQSTLRTVTAEELYDATTESGPLLPGAHRTMKTATDLAATITHSMSLVAPTVGASGAGLNRVGFPNVRSELRPLRWSDSRFSGSIDISKVPEQNWRLEFPSGEPVFTTMSAEEAQAWFTAKRAQLGAGGFLGIDWGAVWQAVKTGVGKVVDAAVSVVKGVANAISTVVTVIIDGLTYIYDGIIHLVEQAFDVIEGVFEQIGVAFQQLYEWLGFLFDWDDILRTKEAIKHTFNQSFSVMSASLKYIQTNAHDLFDTLKVKVAESLDQVIQSQLGGRSLLATGEEAPRPPGFERSMSNNVLQSAFTNNVDASGGIQSPAMEAFAAQGGDPLSTFFTQSEGYSERFANSTHFTKALDYFKLAGNQFLTDPAQALRTTFAAFLEVLSGLADLTLTLAQSVIDSVLTALAEFLTVFQEMMNDPWSIPFVSELYAGLTGGALTALDLMALVLAVPTTVFYKGVYDEAPLPTPAALDNFKSILTADAILQASGMGSTALAAAVAGIPPADGQNSLAKKMKGTPMRFVAILNLFSTVGYGAACAGCDWIEPPGPGKKPTSVENGWSISAIATAVVTWITACPYFSDEDLVGRPQYGTVSQTAALIWVISSIGWSTDVLFYGYFLLQKPDPNEWRMGKKKSLAGDIGVLLNVIIGVVIVVLDGVLVHVQRRDNKYDGLVTASNFIGATPAIFGFLRFTPIAKAGGKKVLVVLCGLDVFCNLLNGVFNFIILLPSTRSSPTAPALTA